MDNIVLIVQYKVGHGLSQSQHKEVGGEEVAVYVTLGNRYMSMERMPARGYVPNAASCYMKQYGVPKMKLLGSLIKWSESLIR